MITTQQAIQYAEAIADKLANGGGFDSKDEQAIDALYRLIKVNGYTELTRKKRDAANKVLGELSSVKHESVLHAVSAMQDAFLNLDITADFPSAITLDTEQAVHITCKLLETEKHLLVFDLYKHQTGRVELNAYIS